MTTFNWFTGTAFGPKGITDFRKREGKLTATSHTLGVFQATLQPDGTWMISTCKDPLTPLKTDVPTLDEAIASMENMEAGWELAQSL